MSRRSSVLEKGRRAARDDVLGYVAVEGIRSLLSSSNFTAQHVLIVLLRKVVWDMFHQTVARFEQTRKFSECKLHASTDGGYQATPRGWRARGPNCAKRPRSYVLVFWGPSSPGVELADHGGSMCLCLGVEGCSVGIVWTSESMRPRRVAQDGAQPPFARQWVALGPTGLRPESWFKSIGKNTGCSWKEACCLARCSRTWWPKAQWRRNDDVFGRTVSYVVHCLLFYVYLFHLYAKSLCHRSRRTRLHLRWIQHTAAWSGSGAEV